jgi:hypothetical protein
MPDSGFYVKSRIEAWLLTLKAEVIHPGYWLQSG